MFNDNMGAFPTWTMIRILTDNNDLDCMKLSEAGPRIHVFGFERKFSGMLCCMEIELRIPIGYMVCVRYSVTTNSLSFENG